MKISVCMATYNGEKYVQEQMLSIIHQLSNNDEVIVSDDNSSDSTMNIINKINDKRIKIYSNEKESGYTRNFENALEKASGDVIFLADQDDIWLKDKVSTSLKYLNDSSFVVSDCTIVDNNLDIIEKSHFKLRKVKKGFLNNLLLPRYVGACMAFKREVLEKSLPFPKNASLSAHDYWLCLVAEYSFSVSLIKQPLVLYRRHGGNASNGGDKSANTLQHKLIVRWYTLFNILKLHLR